MRATELANKNGLATTRGGRLEQPSPGHFRWPVLTRPPLAGFKVATEDLQAEEHTIIAGTAVTRVPIQYAIIANPIVIPKPRGPVGIHSPNELANQIRPHESERLGNASVESDFSCWRLVCHLVS